MSNNLSLPQVAPNQNQKEVTINDQAQGLDAAITEVLQVDLSSGSKILTNAEFTRHFLFVGAGQTVAATLTVPSVKRFFAVQNAGGFDLSVSVGSSSVTVPAGKSALIYSNGSELNQYVGGGSGISDAPVDGKLYGRQDAAWTEVPAGTGGGIAEAPADGKTYGRKDEDWAEIIGDGGGIPEAPIDGKHYIRKDAQWFELEAGTNVTFDESAAGVIKIEASGAVPILEPVRAISDAAYTPVLADAGKYLTFTSASPATATIPANSDVAFPIGTDIAIEQSDIGQVSIAAATGVTINTSYGFNLKTGGQYAVVSLKKTGTDTWTAFGNLEVQA